jgi:hypothetical protein
MRIRILVAACDGVDDHFVVRSRSFPGEAIYGRYVVKPAINAANLVGLGKSLKRLVDTGAGTKVQEIHRSPHRERFSSLHPGENAGLEIESGAAAPDLSDL